MKRLKNILKGKQLIIGLLIGVILIGGVSYGANQLSSESVSYIRDGETKTVKQALDDLIGKSSKVDDLEKKVTDYEKTVHYLADKVKVGDYVAYDAGTWDKTIDKPTKHGEFGGYSINTSKNSSVEWCYRESDKTTLKGWRVLTVDKATKTVTIIHAGQSECYYHGTTPSDSVTKLNERAQNTYVDSKYASSAHALNYNEARAITGNTLATDNTLRTTGSQYWVAGYDNDFDGVYLNGVIADGSLYSHLGINNKFGFRPVVVLKSGILTTGQGPDKVGNDKAWQLIPQQ